MRSRRHVGFLLLLAGLTPLLACGGGGSKSGSTSNVTVGTATGQLAASPPSIDFGSVSVGSSATRPVVLSDPGTGSVTVNSASVSGPGFSVTGLTTPVVLSPGQTSTFNVVFAPTSGGPVSGGVNLANSTTTSPLTVSLSGTGSTIVSGQHTVDLSWTASTSSVSGYNVYRATVSGGPYTLLNTAALITGTTFTDNTVVSGTTYFYVARAVANGLESANSNEAQAIIPTP